MFNLFPLVSEHTIELFTISKMKKIHSANLLRIPGNPPLEKLVFEKFLKKPTFQGRWSRSNYSSKMTTWCHTVIIT